MPSLERSVPAALCRVAGEIGLDSVGREPRPTPDEADRVLETAVTAISCLEGYGRLRLALIDGGSAGDRDDAILASDHLHASAYATVADLPAPDRRRLECYRHLVDGSTALACTLQATDDDRVADDRHSAGPTIAETASAVGAAATGVPTETRTALQRYSHAVMTALAIRAAVTDGVDPRASAARVLADGSSATTPNDGAEADDSFRHVEPAVERHLERARSALATVVDSVDRGSTGPTDASLADEDEPTPLERLERATRTPFHHAATDDE